MWWASFVLGVGIGMIFIIFFELAVLLSFGLIFSHRVGKNWEIQQLESLYRKEEDFS